MNNTPSLFHSYSTMDVNRRKRKLADALKHRPPPKGYRHRRCPNPFVLGMSVWSKAGIHQGCVTERSMPMYDFYHWAVLGGPHGEIIFDYDTGDTILLYNPNLTPRYFSTPPPFYVGQRIFYHPSHKGKSGAFLGTLVTVWPVKSDKVWWGTTDTGESVSAMDVAGRNIRAGQRNHLYILQK